MRKHSDPKYPLFYCLSAAAQALLMQYQYDTYNGQKLVIPAEPDTAGTAPLDTALLDTAPLESPEEMERLMKQSPRHQTRVM